MDSYELKFYSLALSKKNMNLNKIHQTWNAFSELKNIELKYKERQQGDVTQSHYLINYTNNIATFSFIGMLRKSSEGLNSDKTSIIVEFENKLAINNFELKPSNKKRSLFSRDKTPKFEKNILKSLKKFDGNMITLKDNFIRIDTNHIFSTIEEFKYVSDLVSHIKTSYKG